MSLAYRAALGFVIGALVLGSSPARADLQSDIDQAVAILERMPPRAIPEDVAKKAHGFAILNLFKAAAGFSLGGGKGVLVARTDNGWSAPLGIGGGGVGFGLQIGIKVDELVFALNTPKAVEALAKGNFAIGGDISVAFFPWGRTGSVGVTPQAAISAFGNSQGLFAGLSLEGSMVAVRAGDNAEFYGKAVTSKEVLSGSVAPPAGASKLLELLSKY